MARQATGTIVEHRGKDGKVYRALRFRAGGERRFHRLGVVSRAEAERELRGILADIERGSVEATGTGTGAPRPSRCRPFTTSAAQWWLRNQSQLAENTRKDYRWRLEEHLLPCFDEDARWTPSTIDAVERYKAKKLAEDKPLSPRSINMTLTLLGAILEDAVEREPSLSATRREAASAASRERAPRRSYLDTAAADRSTPRCRWRARRSRPTRSAGTSSAVRCWRRSPSRDSASGSCSRFAGATWTSLPDG